MKRFYPLMFLVFLIPSFSLAQSNYKPGYMVKLNGDTVKGYIDYKEWEKNPTIIIFRSDFNNNNTTESITPANTNAFAVTGFEYYRSFNVHISTAQVDMMNVKQGIDTSYVIKKVFLKVLTAGNNCTLFSYQDDIKTRYYIYDKESIQPVELIYRQYYKPDDATFVQTDNTFQVQLQSLAQKYDADDQKLRLDIGSAKYVDMEMVKIIQKINGNNSGQFTPKSTSEIRWFAGLSIIYNNAKLNGQINYPDGSVNTINNGSVFPSIDGGFDIIINKETQKVFFRVEIAATADKHTYSDPADADGNSYNINNVEQYTGSISPQIFYNFINSKSLQVFINGGFSANISSYNNYQFNQTISNVKTTPINEYPQFTHFWVSYPFKAGISIDKKFEIYVGYAPAAQINYYNINFSDKATQYQAGINYLFGVK